MLSGRELGLAAYEAWGQHGVPVFPCGDNKRPLLKWKEGAVTDKDAILDLFDSFGSSARLIGLKTGIEANIFALDFDLYKGDAPKEYMQTLLMAGLLLKTRVHATRSGGLHYLYGVENERDMPRNSVPCEGVEIRGEGGFIIAPPSHGYSVEMDEVLEFAPAGLLKRIDRADKAFKSLSPSKLKEQIIAGESFHEALTALSAKLNAQGMDPAKVMQELSSAMAASVAANPQHKRHDRWQKIMEGGDGELARLASSAYRKFNPQKDTDDLRQVTGKMGKAARNRDVTLGGFFGKPPANDELPPKEGGAFGQPKQTTESAAAPDEFPFKRSYTAAKVDDQDNKRFLIYPLIMEGDTIVLSAAPKAGKTLTTMNICLHAAAGIPIGEQLVPMDKDGKTGKLPIVYFALEGQGAIRKRVKAWVLEQRRMGHDITEDSLRIYIVEQAVNLTDDAAKQDVVDKLVAANAFFNKRGWGDLAMVVFDTLTKAMPGKDQNSVEDTSAVFNTVDMMREVGLGCAVMFIHHNNKTGNGPRGSGNISAEPDTVLSVNKVEQIEKDGAYLDCYRLSVYMARAVDDAQVYNFSAQGVEIGVNSQGIMENAPVLTALENYSAAPTKTASTIKKAAVHAQTKFYEAVWQAMADAKDMTMSYAALHKLATKGDGAVSAFYLSFMNGNTKSAAKAAWAALLSPARLPKELAGMTFHLGENGVSLELDMKKGAAG